MHLRKNSLKLIRSSGLGEKERERVGLGLCVRREKGREGERGRERALLAGHPNNRTPLSNDVWYYSRTCRGYTPHTHTHTHR